jgi:CRISPR/Cas system-associated protein Cas10 (large subunit of type III CRISPR-Cas system)
MSRCEAVLNYNDGVDYYQDVAHSAGVHLEPLRTPSQQEIEEQMERIEEAKNKIHNNKKIQKLNRLKNYLLEANYEIQ